MNIWFTSDYHLGHANINEYCKRPFKNVEEMNRVLIRNHNERVKPNDTVFFLGDFCFKNSKGGKEGEGETTCAEDYLKQLNGRFVFIRGNHDNNNSLKTVIENAVISVGGYEMFLVHDPALAHFGYEVNVCGHVHDNWKCHILNATYKPLKTIAVNVGIDVWNYRPVSLKELLREIEHKKIEQKKKGVLIGH